MRTRERRFLVVTGGRNYKDFDRVAAEIEKVVFEYQIDGLAHGSAQGADAMAKKWWEDKGSRHGVEEMREFKADWKADGKAAGPRRNKAMLERIRPRVVLAFPGGRGTANCVAIAKSMNIPVIEIQP